MKASQKDFARLAAKAAQVARVFFFCGPDEAGTNDAAMRIVSLLPDAGERIEFTSGELKRDPVRLGDEARSTSLFGDARHIWVRASGDEAHDAVATLLSGPMTGAGAPFPVVIVATSATDKSRTAKLLADRPDALVAMFYPPDLRAVTGAVRDMCGPLGLRMNEDVAERIARASGLDTRLARSEMAKLALYLDAAPESPRDVTASAIDAIGAKTEDDGFNPLVNAVLGGDLARLPGELWRMRELGMNPVGLLLAFERRVAQLVQLAGKIGPRGDVVQTVKLEAQARRVFFKDEKDLTDQLKRWRGRKLARLVDRLVALHRNLLSNNQNAELLLSQGLAEIARAAAAAR